MSGPVLSHGGYGLQAVARDPDHLDVGGPRGEDGLQALGEEDLVVHDEHLDMGRFPFAHASPSAGPAAMGRGR